MVEGATAAEMAADAAADRVQDYNRVPRRAGWAMPVAQGHPPAVMAVAAVAAQLVLAAEIQP